MILPAFELLRPRTLDEAAALLAEHGAGVKVLGGGTDLIPSMKQGLFSPPRLLSLRGIDALRAAEALPAGGLRLGASRTLAQVAADERVVRGWPALAAAAGLVGTPLVRARATLGGNLLLDTRCLYYNQSAFWRGALGGCLKKDGPLCHVAPGSGVCLAAFSADTAGPLLAYGAEVEILSVAGGRRIPLAQLYAPGDGAAWHRLAPGELLTAVTLPPADPALTVVYLKHRLRQAIDFPLVGIAAAVRRTSGGAVVDARLWLTAVDTHPVGVALGDLVDPADPEGRWVEEAPRRAASAARPLGTHGVSPGYRTRLVRVLTGRALRAALGMAGPR